MCGIFGFASRKPIPIATVFAILKRLEVHQYPQESRPVGGYGAGVAIINAGGNVAVEKVGKAGGSPARHLQSLVSLESAHVLVGHVRMPSPQFMEKAQFAETAQPYVSKCFGDSVVVSVHNGYVANYKDIRLRLKKEHIFESERVEFVDSEVIPHCFEELMERRSDRSDAAEGLHSLLEGSNAIGILHVGKQGKTLHLIHKGKTRGLFAWTNRTGEIVFCSRKEPVLEEMSKMLASAQLKETVSIPYKKDENFKATFDLDRVAPQCSK